MIWLDATGRVAELAAINAADTRGNNVGIVTGALGTPLVPADLLDEAGAGKLYEAWGEVLRSLPVANDEPE